AFSDAARYIGPIGAGSVAKLVHNCAGYGIQMALAEVFSLGIKAGVEPLALWEAVRTGARRQRTFDRLYDPHPDKVTQRHSTGHARTTSVSRQPLAATPAREPRCHLPQRHLL